MADWHELGSTRRQPEEPPKEPEPQQHEQLPEQEPVAQSKPRRSKKKLLLLCGIALIVVAAIVLAAVVALNGQHAEAPNDTLLGATTIQAEAPTETETTPPQPETPEEKFWYCAEKMYTIAHSADYLCGVWEKDSGDDPYMRAAYLRKNNPAAAKMVDDLVSDFHDAEEMFQSIEQFPEEYADAMQVLRRVCSYCGDLVDLAENPYIGKKYKENRARLIKAIDQNTNDLEAFAAEMGQEFNPVLPPEPETATEAKEPDGTEAATYDHETVETAIKALMSDQKASVQYNESNNTYYIFMFSETPAESYNSANPVFASAREDLERSLDNLCLAIVGISGEHAEISYLSSDTLEPLYVTRDGVDITDSGVKY